MKNKYERDNNDHFYLVRNFLRESDPITDTQEKLHHLSFTNIKAIPEFISYETYATLQDVGYRLNIGEEYEGNVIENVEGTEDGDIVYYTDKIINVDENLEEKKEFSDRLNETIQYYDNELKKLIEEMDKKKWYQFWK